VGHVQSSKLQGSSQGFRLQGSGFTVYGLRFRICGLGFRSYGSYLRAFGLEFARNPNSEWYTLQNTNVYDLFLQDSSDYMTPASDINARTQLAKQGTRT